MGIRRKMISMFVILITIPLIALGIGSYNKTLDIIENDLEEISVCTLEGVDTSVENYLCGYEKIINMMTDNLNVKEILSHPEYEPWMLDLFKGIEEANKDIVSVYIGTKNKKVYSYPYQELSSNYELTERPWYKGAYEKKGISWTQPYVDASSKKLTISVSAPVYDIKANDFIGVVAIDIDLEILANVINKMKIGNNGYPFLIDANGNYMTHKNTKKIGSKLEIKEIVDAISTNKQGYITYAFEGKKKNAAFITMEKTGWKIIGTTYTNEILNRANVMIYSTIVIGGIALLVAIIIAYFFSKYVTKFIELLLADMQRIKDGDFTVRSNIKSNDEFGKLSKSFNITLDHLSNLLRNISVVSYETKNSAENLASTAEETSAISEQVANSVDEITKGAASQASDIDQGVNITNNLADKLNELADNTKHMLLSANDVVKSNSDGINAIEDLKNKTQITSDTTNKMEKAVLELDNKSKAIQNMVNAITAIAEQTNLLALNAAIESARVGEQGKGFAVVANEIRELADESANAANEIKLLVESVENDSEYTVKIMQEVKDVTGEQVSAVSRVNTSFMNISQSIEMITGKINTISDFVNHMNKEKDLMVASIENISAVSEQTAACSKQVNVSMQQQTVAVEEVAKAADKLNELSIKLNDEIKRFKI